MVNNVKGSALNSRLFKILCEDLGADHSVLLFHSNVRWLSRGNVTKRVYELRKELLGFFQQLNKCETLVTSLRDDFFILILAYLVDIFDTQNMLNKNLQGKDLTVPVNIHHHGFSAAGLGESWQNYQHLTNNANFLPMIYF